MPAAESCIEFLVEQLRNEQDAWQKDHEAAMGCRDVEDVVRRGNALFFLIRMADETWSRKVQCGAENLDPVKVREIHKSYEWWIAPAAEVLKAIQKAEEQYEVEGAQEFRRCLRRAKRILEVNVDDLIGSFVEAASASN